MVKLAPKEGFAEVPEEVLEKIKELRIKRAKQIASEYNRIKLEMTGNRNQWQVESYQRELKGLEVQLAMLRRTGGGSVVDGASRGGMSEVRMRMRRLPFEKFYLKSRTSHMGPQSWIFGLTKRILSTISTPHLGKNGQRTDGPRTYDLGKYYVAVLCESIGTQQPTFHLMPESNPTTMARHMHHHVHSGLMGSSGSNNPLDWTPANCLGTFSEPIHRAFENADIPELFRMVHIFTKQMNPDSPLLTLPQLPHVHVYKEPKK